MCFNCVISFQLGKSVKMSVRNDCEISDTKSKRSWDEIKEIKRRTAVVFRYLKG